MSDLLEEVKQIQEGFASDAQRRAAFASGYKAKGKKGKKEEVDESTKEYAKSMEKMANKAKKDQLTSKDLDTLAKLVQLMQKQTKEEVELDEVKEPFVVVDTADGNKVVATASDEKGAKSSIASAELPPIKIKDKKTLKVMKSKKKQMIGQPFKEEVELDETMEDEFGEIKASKGRQGRMMDAAVDALHRLVTSKGSKTSLGGHAFTIAQSYRDITPRELEKLYIDKHGMPEETEPDVEVIKGYFSETKSSTGYELFHKDFSSAMRHAYDHAKRKLGVTIDPDEIDDKVAMGPRKPSKGKTNSYRLMGTDKSGKSKGIQIQVYNMGSRFELNMYKESIDEEVELDEKFQSRRPSSKEVKMAIGIANDPRYAKGNMTGAVKAIEKIRDGLSDYPEVAAALRKANENTVHEASMKIGNIDFELFDSMKGSKAANMAMNKEIKRASQMKDYKTARAYMAKVQDKYEKFGANDSEPQRTIDAVLKKVFSEAIDPADFDISATSKDKEQADKNVLIQLRKVITLKNAHKGVEFTDGSKQKVHPNIAAAALSMHQKLRRTDEKDAFQNKISKSYKDLLNAVKGR